MSDFDRLLAEATQKENPSVHGAMMKCVDKKGTEIYSKISGYDSLSVDASPLRFDAVLKLASATKLVTSIALLQCIDRKLLALDEPMTKVLPELASKPIIHEASSAPGYSFTPSSVPITARHLLTHTSGLGYRFTNPLLAKWSAETDASKAKAKSNFCVDRFDLPLAFEPGKGFLYGSSLDWAGVAVKRLTGYSDLDDYLTDHVWRPLGLVAPFPTFHLSRYPAYEARLMQAARSVEDTSVRLLEPADFMYGNNPDDEEGGTGLVCTLPDYLAVLRDLVADDPVLLSRDTRDRMFEPQMEADSEALRMLRGMRWAWEPVAGPVRNEHVNHGLGGLLVQGETPEIAMPSGVLCWGGASNVVWFANRDQGVAGFFATQITMWGASRVVDMVNAWKKDFWSGRAGNAK